MQRTPSITWMTPSEARIFNIHNIQNIQRREYSKNSVYDMDDSIRGENILLNDGGFALACSHTEPYCAARYLTI